MMNRIIQMEEKNREAERNATLVTDFRTVLSKLNSLEKLDLVRSALKALETENEKYSTVTAVVSANNKREKSDFDEKFNGRSGHDEEPNLENANSCHEEENREQRDESFFKASSNRELELHNKIKEFQEENKRLFANIEELDRQHEESIEELLSLKEEIERKHQCLQNAYEQLYVEYNQAQDVIVQLKDQLTKKSECETVQPRTMITASELSARTTNGTESVVDKYNEQANDSEVIEEQNGNQQHDGVVDDELADRVKNILKSKSCGVETEPNETIFEALAKQYVDMKWKKDVVEKWVSELNRELKGVVEMKEDLQMECSMKQSHIDTLLQEIDDIKSSLPSIPEANEERVASLELENESLHEEVKRLQAENAAIRKRNALRKKNAVRAAAAAAGLINESLSGRSKSQAHAAAASRKKAAAAAKLENIPEDIEDTFNTMENLSRRLHASLDENDVLRKKIDVLENTEKETQEQLTKMSLEKKCMNSDKNDEFVVEELKHELENARQELTTSAINVQRLENSLTLLRDAKKEIQRENEELSTRNEQLEIEISQWRKSSSETEESRETLKNLEEELNDVTREKENLEYDILNIRKELDEALDLVDSKETRIVKLNQENENLIKEKDSLLEQLTAIQDESNDKIDLVSIEKTLLEQEQAELNEKLASNEKQLNETIERLREAEERYAKMKSKFLSLTKMDNDDVRNGQEFELENENLYNKIRKRSDGGGEEESWNDLELVELIEKLNFMKKDYTRLANELDTLRRGRQEEGKLTKFEENLTTFAEDNNNKKTLKSEYETVHEMNCNKLENDVAACLQTEKKELLNRLNENVRDNNVRGEQEQMSVLLMDDDEKTRENERLKEDNDRLMSEVMNLQMKLQEAVDNSTESTDMARQTIESLSHLIREKDEEIGNLKNALKLSKDNAETLDSHFITVKSERDELVKLVTTKHEESLRYHAEIQRLTQLLNEEASRIQSLLAENDLHRSELKDKEAELLWTRNELQAVQQRLKNAEESSRGETCGIVEHSTQAAEISILTEKCNALEAALIQEQSNNRMLQNQFNESQSKEANAAKELERLRAHLVEIESSYTEDALLAEEARKELEAKLQQAEEKVKSSSTAYTSANIRANQQVETLQQQMALIIQQRSEIQNKLSAAEDKINSQTVSLTNLQIVLEQFQRDKERDIAAATERIQSKLNESYKKQEELTSEIINLKEQLVEARECLQAASRLSEELDRKTERIEQLSQEVERLTQLVNTADVRIEEAKQSGEGKVDKILVKNLLLGYLVASSAVDKSSVLRVFSTVLDFTESEKDKAGLNNATAQHSWFSRLSGGSTTVVPNSKDQEASLSAAFIRFLENESKPKPQLPPLPIHAPQTLSSTRPGHSRQHSTSSTQSTSLLSNVNLPTFPDFIPARNTGSILKEVLKDS